MADVALTFATIRGRTKHSMQAESKALCLIVFGLQIQYVQKTTPKRAPFCGPDSGVQKVKAHRWPSHFAHWNRVRKTAPIFGPSWFRICAARSLVGCGPRARPETESPPVASSRRLHSPVRACRRVMCVVFLFLVASVSVFGCVRVCESVSLCVCVCLL